MVYARFAIAAAILVIGYVLYSKRKQPGFLGKLNKSAGQKLMKGVPKALSLPNLPAPIL
jgi:hypothetical protein